MEGRLRVGGGDRAARHERPALRPAHRRDAARAGRDRLARALDEPAGRTELAVYLDANGGIAAIGAAIGLVDLRSQTDDPAEIVAGNVYHRYVLLGRERANAADGLKVRVRRGGETVAETDDPQALNGKLEDVVRLLHETVGDRVRPGDVVIAGPAVPPIPVCPGDEIRYELAPLGSIAVSFAASASSVSS